MLYLLALFITSVSSLDCSTFKDPCEHSIYVCCEATSSAGTFTKMTDCEACKDTTLKCSDLLADGTCESTTSGTGTDTGSTTCPNECPAPDYKCETGKECQITTSVGADGIDQECTKCEPTTSGTGTDTGSTTDCITCQKGDCAADLECVFTTDSDGNECSQCESTTPGTGTDTGSTTCPNDCPAPDNKCETGLECKTSTETGADGTTQTCTKCEASSGTVNDCITCKKGDCAANDAASECVFSTDSTGNECSKCETSTSGTGGSTSCPDECSDGKCETGFECKTSTDVGADGTAQTCSKCEKIDTGVSCTDKCTFATAAAPETGCGDTEKCATADTGCTICEAEPVSSCDKCSTTDTIGLPGCTAPAICDKDAAGCFVCVTVTEPTRPDDCPEVCDPPECDAGSSCQTKTTYSSDGITKWECASCVLDEVTDPCADTADACDPNTDPDVCPDTIPNSKCTTDEFASVCPHCSCIECYVVKGEDACPSTTGVVVKCVPDAPDDQCGLCKDTFVDDGCGDGYCEEGDGTCTDTQTCDIPVGEKCGKCEEEPLNTGCADTECENDDPCPDTQTCDIPTGEKCGTCKAKTDVVPVDDCEPVECDGTACKISNDDGTTTVGKCVEDPSTDCIVCEEDTGSETNPNDGTIDDNDAGTEDVPATTKDDTTEDDVCRQLRTSITDNSVRPVVDVETYELEAVVKVLVCNIGKRFEEYIYYIIKKPYYDLINELSGDVCSIEDICIEDLIINVIPGNLPVAFTDLRELADPATIDDCPDLDEYCGADRSRPQYEIYVNMGLWCSDKEELIKIMEKLEDKIADGSIGPDFEEKCRVVSLEGDTVCKQGFKHVTVDGGIALAVKDSNGNVQDGNFIDLRGSGAVEMSYCVGLMAVFSILSLFM